MSEYYCDICGKPASVEIAEPDDISLIYLCEKCNGDEQHGDWCPECQGTGRDRWQPWFDCKHCFGEGYVWW